jgi:hypothetical protein
MSTKPPDPSAATRDEPHEEPPDIKESRLGWRNAHKEQKQRKKKAKQGYIQWYLIDETWPEPKYVKPKAKGGGIAEFEHEGHTYLFPRKARLPSEREGMWTVVHRKGEADPINPQESHSPAIKSDTLQEYLTMRVSSSAPGLFDRLDLDPKTVMMVLIGSIILFAILSDVFGGGV